MGGRVPAPWVRCYEERPQARSRVVCFPHAGGTASFFYPWQAKLPPDVELWIVQYPGHEERLKEPLEPDIRVLVRDLVAALAPDPRPTVLFGHSMGSTVAYECAQELDPAHLFVSANSGPSRQTKSANPAHLKSDDDLVTDLARLGGTVPRLLEHPQLRRLVLPVIRNDFQLMHDYRPTPGGLTCPVTALGAEDDPVIDHDTLAAWREVTSGPYEEHWFTGGHFYLAAHVDAVITLVANALGSVVPRA